MEKGRDGGVFGDGLHFVGKLLALSVHVVDRRESETHEATFLGCEVRADDALKKGESVVRVVVADEGTRLDHLDGSRWRFDRHEFQDLDGCTPSAGTKSFAGRRAENAHRLVRLECEGEMPGCRQPVVGASLTGDSAMHRTNLLGRGLALEVDLEEVTEERMDPPGGRALAPSA